MSPSGGAQGSGDTVGSLVPVDAKGLFQNNNTKKDEPAGPREGAAGSSFLDGIKGEANW